MLPTLRTARTSQHPPRRGRGPQPRLSPKAISAQPLADTLQLALSVELLFQHARDALVLIDVASDQIVRWNPAAEQLFGYSVDQAVGRNVQMLMPPGMAHLHRERMAHFRRTGDTEVLLDRPLSVPARHRSGAELRVELSVTPIERPGAPRRWVLLSFRDARCEQVAELGSVSSARGDAAREDADRQFEHLTGLLAETTRAIA